MARKRFHLEGYTDKGEPILAECGGDTSIVAHPLEHGKPLSPGRGIGTMSVSDGHITVESEDFSDAVADGSFKAVNDAYREGWDRIFSSDTKEEMN